MLSARMLAGHRLCGFGLDSGGNGQWSRKTFFLRRQSRSRLQRGVAAHQRILPHHFDRSHQDLHQSIPEKIIVRTDHP